ncbi:enoyl-(Acyl carrier protein) reductase domain-containing protein [Phthorimaea operculella]|nr:enoyl-(Acyl carrier protein) reductase domain-containing protein [Phthorimaea operculella]
MSFENKVVLVTGASSGIGAATAILFAKEGAHVVMVGRNQKKLDTVAAQVDAVGKKPLVINADVSKDDDVKRIIEETIKKFGKLDVLVNNAGMATDGSIVDGNILQAYDIVMSVNVRAVINLTNLAAPYLATTKGNVVNVSSIAALTTLPKGYLAYTISKAALDHFTRGAALELAPKGVRVNSVNPGPVETDFFDTAADIGITCDDFKAGTALNRSCSSEEIASLISYLAGNKAKGITGSSFVIDNGWMLK